MINWSEINTVLLDMDGTLLDLRFDNFFWQTVVPQRYADKSSCSVAQAKEYLLPIFKAQEGLLNWYCLDYWSEILGLNIAQLKHEHQEHIQVLPHTREFLQALKRSGKRCVLVTNAHVDSLSLKMQKTGLVEFFDAIVCSHDLGYPKENPQFWETLQRVEAFEVEHTLLVDDSLNVLKSADHYGIQHLVAISHPDSSQKPRLINEFLAVKNLAEIIPA